MRNLRTYIVLLLAAFCMQNIAAQENNLGKIKLLEQQKERIRFQEKEVLKIEIEAIEKKLKSKEITFDEAQSLKAAAAKKRALNIENKIAILSNKIALLERNGTDVLIANDLLGDRVEVEVFDIKFNNKSIFSNTKNDSLGNHRSSKIRAGYYFAAGLNNAIIDGQPLEDSPYKIGGSKFFELGWEYYMPIFKNVEWVRLQGGVSLQFNGLKPVDNQYFVRNGNQTELQEFDFDLRKSKFRMDNLVFPLHIEFGDMKKIVADENYSYFSQKRFKIGVGGYGGFNLGARQKLKYKEDGNKQKDKLKGGYNTSSFVYGLSAYVGSGNWATYIKYDLSPIFKDAVVEQQNISLGLRFSLD